SKKFQIATNFLYEFNRHIQLQSNQYYINELYNLIDTIKITFNIETNTYTQKKLIDNIDQINYNKIIKCADNRIKTILYNSKYSNSTNQWIHVKPNNVNGKKFTNYMFMILLKRRFNVPIISSEQKCRGCNGNIDKYGDHALICKNGNNIVRR